MIGSINRWIASVIVPLLVVACSDRPGSEIHVTGARTFVTMDSVWVRSRRLPAGGRSRGAVE
jgi:hypothetical protein